jgi:hypothetical protein
VVIQDAIGLLLVGALNAAGMACRQRSGHRCYGSPWTRTQWMLPLWLPVDAVDSPGQLVVDAVLLAVPELLPQEFTCRAPVVNYPLCFKI